MENPSGPAGHLPYKAEEFCLRTGKLFAAMDFKSRVVGRFFLHDQSLEEAQ